MKKKKKRLSRRQAGKSNVMFKTRNYVLFIGAVLAIGLGFYLLSKGSITLAPILLVLGYCVLVPLAILLK